MPFELWLENLRYAGRRLRRSPGFTAAVLLILTLGIGANTAIFSVVYGVLLKPLAFPQPERLVAIHEGMRGEEASFRDLPVNANHYVYWREHARSFAGIAAMLGEAMPLGGGAPEEIGVMQGTANLFAVLGVAPRVGRTFSHEEEQPGHERVVILTDGLWKRRYGADTGVVGKTITMDGNPYVVVGVMPENFRLPDSKALGQMRGSNKMPEAFVPLAWDADTLQEIEGDHNYFAMGRLKSGVSAAGAMAELNVLQRAISTQTPDKVNYSAAVIPLQEYLTGASRKSLLLLLAAVGAVFLIACVNIANLLLTRALSGEREIAVKIALGSTRAQLLAGALGEPAILCAAGWLLGVGMAVAAMPVLMRNMPIEMPRLGDVHVDLAAMAFAAAVSAIAALLCSVLPVWRYLHTDAEPALRANARTASAARGARRAKNTLVAGEVAGSVALVAIAGLFVTSMMKVLSVGRGFDAEHVLSAEVVLPEKQYGAARARNAFYERTLHALRGLPGVKEAGLVSVLPLDGDYWGDLIAKVGDTRPRWEQPSGHFRWISPGYFESMRIPLLAGRFLEERDQGKRVAVISRSAAAKVWPHESAIGRRFHRADPDEAPFEVIGVVDDVRTLDLSKAPPLMVYAPYWYRSRTAGTFVIRTEFEPAEMNDAVRRAIWSIDAQVPVPRVPTMETVVSGSVEARRFLRNLLAGFAGCAMLLAALGIYGVVAYNAVERRQEIGIRMAVGASRADVCGLMVGQGIAPVLAGTAAGIGMAIVGGRLIHGLLFEVSGSDPLVTGLAAAILIAVGVCACLAPAWRAARTEPLKALRVE